MDEVETFMNTIETERPDVTEDELAVLQTPSSPKPADHAEQAAELIGMLNPKTLRAKP
jgi:hypothetical protein